MKKIYFLIGIKRSGNHAILNWFYKIIPNYVHLNNMSLPLFTVNNYRTNITTKALQYNYCDRRWVPFSENHNLLISFEDQDLKKIGKMIEQFCKELNLEPVIMLLLRSPQNNLASAYQVYNKNVNVLAKYVTQWQLYATEYLENTIFPHKINIFYDKWFTDEAYRKELCTQLGFKFNDSNFNHIYKHGTSSFDKMKFMNNASQMDVLHRNKVFDNDERFVKLANNKKLVAIWEKILDKEKYTPK